MTAMDAVHPRAADPHRLWRGPQTPAGASHATNGTQGRDTVTHVSMIGISCVFDSVRVGITELE